MQDMKEKRDRGVLATEEGIEKLKNARANQRNGNGKPWTYADIAEAAGLDEKTVGRFIRQEQPVDENSARAICEVLGVDALEVIDFEKDKKGQLDNNDLAFSITGSFEKSKINVAKLKAIEASLREIAGDVSLKIVDIEEGSIKLILEGSQEGLERLEQLFKSGELTEILDIPVEDVNFVDVETSEGNKKRLAFTINANVTTDDIENLKAAFTETSNLSTRKNKTTYTAPKVNKWRVFNNWRTVDFSFLLSGTVVFLLVILLLTVLLHYVNKVFDNYVLLVALIACFVAQVLKFTIELIKNNKVNVSALVTTGGMPSTHSAVVTALAAGVGQTIGWASPEFALAAIFAITVMYDAIGVRQATGKQARILNQVIDEMFYDHPEIANERRNELFGYTTSQVIVGSALGIIISLLAQAVY